MKVEPAKLRRGQARRLAEDVWASHGAVPWSTIDGWLSRGCTLAFYESQDSDGRVQRRVQHFGAAHAVQQHLEDMRLVATYAGAPLSSARPSKHHPLGSETGSQDPAHAAERTTSAHLREAALRAGASESEAAFLAAIGVDAGWISGPVADAMPFFEAADYQDLGAEYIEALLKESKGDAQEAWEIWARDETEEDDWDEEEADDS